MTSRWARAGVRADPVEAARDRQKKAGRNLQHQLSDERYDAEFVRAWQRGQVRPYRITLALDLRGLDGPEVDLACGAQEPDVDRWELGELYPSLEQLRLLAKLTDVRPWFFVEEHPEAPIHWTETSMRYHVSRRELLLGEKEPDAVLQFTFAAIRARGMF